MRNSFDKNTHAWRNSSNTDSEKNYFQTTPSPKNIAPKRPLLRNVGSFLAHFFFFCGVLTVASRHYPNIENFIMLRKLIVILYYILWQQCPAAFRDNGLICLSAAEWWYGPTVCKVAPYLQGVAVSASVHTLAAIALERWAVEM